MSKRIWELDALRGICILGMVIVHFAYDLVELYRIVTWQYPVWFTILRQIGAVLFVVLSGLCVTLGSRSIRRGLTVFGLGMVITAVTYGMYRLGFSGKGIIIYFGVLQCLGVCMLLWPAFKKLPWWALALLGVAAITLGLWLQNQPPVQTQWLMPLGLPWWGFVSADYFPLFPNLGYFLLGAAIGRTVYRRRQTLLPQIHENAAPVRFFCFMGRHSLEVYILHQPLLSGLCWLLTQVI